MPALTARLERPGSGRWYRVGRRDEGHLQRHEVGAHVPPAPAPNRLPNLYTLSMAAEQQSDFIAANACSSV